MVGSPVPFSDRTNSRTNKRSRLPNILSPSTRKPKKKSGRLGETPISIRSAKNDSALSETPNRHKFKHPTNDSPTTRGGQSSTPTPSKSIFKSPLRRSSSGSKERKRQNKQNTPRERVPPVSLFADVGKNLPAVNERSEKEQTKAKILENLEQHLKLPSETSPLVAYLRNGNEKRAKGWLRKDLFGKGSGRIRTNDELNFIQKFASLEHSTYNVVISALSVAWGTDKRTMKKYLPEPPAPRVNDAGNDEIFSHATVFDEPMETNEQCGTESGDDFVAESRQDVNAFEGRGAPVATNDRSNQCEFQDKRQMLLIAWSHVYPTEPFPVEMIVPAETIVGGNEWYSNISTQSREQFPNTSIGVDGLTFYETVFAKGLCNSIPAPVAPVPMQQTFGSTCSPDQTSEQHETEDVTCTCLEARKRGLNPRKCGRFLLRDEPLPGGHVVKDVPGNYVLVPCSEDGKNQIARGTLAALEKFLKRRQVCMTIETAVMYGAFSAAFPTTPAEQQSMFIGLGRFTFLKEFAAQLPPDLRYSFEQIFNLRAVFRISPSARTIETTCITELATQQAFIFSYRMSNIPFPCLQSDKGPDASEVQIASWWNPDDKTFSIRGSPNEFIMGLQRSGKTADESAEAIDFNCSLLGLERGVFKFFSVTGDSGGSGDAQKFANVLIRMDRFFGWGLADSCGHHDTQSIFRLPTLHLFGTGGIGKRNPPQCLHLLYSVFKTFAELRNWKDLVRVLYKELHGEGQEPPKELLEFIQNPLITRWWTLGDVSCFLMRYWQLFVRIAQTAVCYAKSKSEQYIKASELWSLLEEPGIKAGVAFIAGFTKSYLNPNMAWYGTTDPNIGVPGKLAFHRTARYFLQVKTLERLRNGGWKSDSKFDDFQRAVQLVEDGKERDFMEKTPDKYLDIALDQLHKHTKPYVNSSRLVRAAFGEKPLAISVARLLLDQNLVRENETVGFFSSPMQRTNIEISEWNDFLTNGTSNCIDEIRGGELVRRYRPCLEKIADGLDLWNEDNQEAVGLSTEVLVQFAMNSQSQQNNERAVGQVSRLRESGKSEKVATLYLLGGNGMMISSVFEEQHRQLFGVGFDESDDESDDDDDDSDDDDENDNTKQKKKRLRGWRRAASIQANVLKVLREYGTIWETMDLNKCNDLRQKIEKGLEDKNETFFAKRQREDLAKLKQASKEPPKYNAIVKKSGYDMPARARDKIPLSSIKGSDGHLPFLIEELRYRHIPFYVVYNPKGTNTIVSHPLPEPEGDLRVTGRDGDENPLSFENMGIKALKSLLMADQERMYYMDDDDGIEFVGNGVSRLRYKAPHWNEHAEMLHDKEFEIDIPLRRKPIDHFDRLETNILKPGLELRFKPRQK